MVSPLVSIITVNYNETISTCALLESIRRQHYRNVEVMVVDNASRENPALLLKSQYPELHFIRSEQNLGFAGGNNLALSKAKGKYLFFVNNDAEIDATCIDYLVELFEKNEHIGIASPLICYFPEHGEISKIDETKPAMVQYAGMTQVSSFTGRNKTLGERELDQGQFKEPQPSAYAHGAAMMIPRAVLEKVGPMWEGFFLYYEELDWCERIRRAGFEVWMTPEARIWHKESLTVGKMGTSKIYYLSRNRILFMRRNVRSWKRFVFFLYLIFVLIPKNSLSYILSGDFGRLKAFLKGVGAGLMYPNPVTP